MLAQLIHILVLASCIYVLTSGFTFFLRLRGSADFSYMAIVVFGAYTTVILTESGFHPVVALFLSFLASIVFTILILRIIKRLSLIYFNIGTFSLYILMSYLATNMSIT